MPFGENLIIYKSLFIVHTQNKSLPRATLLMRQALQAVI